MKSTDKNVDFLVRKSRLFSLYPFNSRFKLLQTVKILFNVVDYF